jgi:hypothetical protein
MTLDWITEMLKEGVDCYEQDMQLAKASKKK